MAQSDIIKIAVLGAESTGKTWLCEALAGYYRTAWVPEFAREYFNDSDIYNYSLNDLEIIAGKQLEAEDFLLGNANRFLFCDTTLITLKIWAELEFKQTPPLIENGLRRSDYRHYFLTGNDIAWQEDKLRQNKHSRDLLFEMNKAEIIRTGTPFSVITGTDQHRLMNAVKIIDSIF